MSPTIWCVALTCCAISEFGSQFSPRLYACLRSYQEIVLSVRNTQNCSQDTESYKLSLALLVDHFVCLLERQVMGLSSVCSQV